MSIDMKDLPAAVQKQILKQMRDADARKAEKDAKERGRQIAAPKKENKLHAQRTADGHASIKEANRAAELRIMQKAGQIYNLREQVPYVLLPAVYQKKNGEYVRVWDRSKKKKDVEKECGEKLTLIERNCIYVADFVYEKDGQTIVEDAKGFKDPSSATYAKFVLKRKMMMNRGIRVVEV